MNKWHAAVKCLNVYNQLFIKILCKPLNLSEREAENVISTWLISSLANKNTKCLAWHHLKSKKHGVQSELEQKVCMLLMASHLLSPVCVYLQIS